MKDERLLKRSETKKQGGCSKRERAQLRWEDCLKRPDSPEKGRGRRKVEGKGQQKGAMENNNEGKQEEEQNVGTEISIISLKDILIHSSL